ncbi:MAG TPA: GNAT family N-acetyltransferase [Candidatus Baltobacteraceae bacterium]|jgi:GNAT superfamily N-acetyltransferase|nr:GNAT family N-acetyltransferase [Candidatus Baltobacteraceae bacterium]
MRASELGTSVREALAGDAPRIVALSAQLGYEVSQAHVEQYVHALNADRTVLVAVVPRVGVVGWIGIQKEYTVTSRNRAHVEGLVVEDEYRGNGIGRLLLERAETWARRNGCTRVRLLSNAVRTRAHSFYHRLGYEAIKREYVFEKPL